MVMQMEYLFIYSQPKSNEKRILTLHQSLVINCNTIKIHELYREHIGEGKYVTFTDTS